MGNPSENLAQYKKDLKSVQTKVLIRRHSIDYRRNMTKIGLEKANNILGRKAGNNHEFPNKRRQQQEEQQQQELRPLEQQPLPDARPVEAPIPPVATAAMIKNKRAKKGPARVGGRARK